MMVFQDYKIEGNKITFTKEELQEAHEHFCKVADKYKPQKNREWDMRYAYYLGKCTILRDMLKLFEPIDFI